MKKYYKYVSSDVFNEDTKDTYNLYNNRISYSVHEDVDKMIYVGLAQIPNTMIHVDTNIVAGIIICDNIYSVIPYNNIDIICKIFGSEDEDTKWSAFKCTIIDTKSQIIDDKLEISYTDFNCEHFINNMYRMERIYHHLNSDEKYLKEICFKMPSAKKEYGILKNFIKNTKYSYDISPRISCEYDSDNGLSIVNISSTFTMKMLRLIRDNYYLCRLIFYIAIVWGIVSITISLYITICIIMELIY